MGILFEEATFLAFAGLGALDAFLRLAPPRVGVWRRRREDEVPLREAWALRRPGDGPGPPDPSSARGGFRSDLQRSRPP